jgi:hypothetical protein
MLKRILSIVAAIATAAITFFIFESFTHKLFPLPAGTDVNNIESINAAMKHAPFGAFAILLLGYAVGSFLGGIVLRKLLPQYDRIKPAIVGVVLTITGALNFFSFYHPIWVIIIGLLLFLPCVFLGYHIFNLPAKQQEIN